MFNHVYYHVYPCICFNRFNHFDHVDPVPAQVRMDHGRRVDLELDPLNLVPGDIIFVQAGSLIFC